MIRNVRATLPLLLIVLVAAVAGVAAASWASRASQNEVALTGFVGPPPSNLRLAVSSSSSVPDVLLSMSTPGNGVVPPIATATSGPKLPEWVRNGERTRLWSSADSLANALLNVPEDSPLKVLSASGNRLQVYYGGDGGKQKGAEGWIDGTSAAAGSAPGWVSTRTDTRLRASREASSQVLASLPNKITLEVLEDRGDQLRVFYAGDGTTSPELEGWTDSGNLGAHATALAAEGRGIRLLTRADAFSLKGAGVWLRVPYRSQLDGSPSEGANCGPASVAMVLGYFGRLVSTPDARRVAEKLQGTSDPEDGFAIEYLVGSVEHYGLKALDLYAGRILKRWSLDDVRRHLSHGDPVIPQLRYRLLPGRGDSDYLEDHYVVLTGMRGNDFTYNDPVDVDGPGYGRIIDADGLMRAWAGSYFPFAAFAVSAP